MSWNSSGDEDSSISLKKPLSPKRTELNQINEELNETYGSKKSGNSNNDQNEQKKVNNSAFSNEFVESTSEISMNNLSSVERLVNTLIRPDKKNTSSDSNQNNSKDNNYTNSLNNESTDLVDLLLNEMNMPTANNDKKQKQNSISLISLNYSNLLEQQPQNKTNMSTLTQVTQFSSTSDRQKKAANINNDTSIVMNNSNGVVFNDSQERMASDIVIRPFSSMSDDNDPYQASAKSFVQLAGTLKNDSKHENLIEVDDDDDDDDNDIYNSKPNRIVSFASLSNQNRNNKSQTEFNNVAVS